MTFSAYYKSRMHTLELPTSRVSSPQTPHPCSEMAGLKSFFDRIGVATYSGQRLIVIGTPTEEQKQQMAAIGLDPTQALFVRSPRPRRWVM